MSTDIFNYINYGTISQLTKEEQHIDQLLQDNESLEAIAGKTNSSLRSIEYIVHNLRAKKR
jgi:hypothetical protein